MSSASVMINKAELMVVIDVLRDLHHDLQAIQRVLRELDKTIQENNDK